MATYFHLTIWGQDIIREGFGSHRQAYTDADGIGYVQLTDVPLNVPLAEGNLQIMIVELPDDVDIEEICMRRVPALNQRDNDPFLNDNGAGNWVEWYVPIDALDAQASLRLLNFQERQRLINEFWGPGYPPL